MKLVSIGFATRNHAELLRKALNSLLAQTYTNFELIISDNASTDETRKICEEYANKDNRIRYILQKENIGGLRNFEFVLSVARGDYFMWAADDDWWEPEFISVLARALDNRPECGVAMSSFRRLFEDGQSHREIRWVGKFDFSSLDYAGILRKMMMFRTPPLLCIYGLFRTKLLKGFLVRPFKHCIAPDRVLMCEVALATRFYTDGRVLWYKKDYKHLSQAERAQDVLITKVHRSKNKIIYFMIAVIVRLTTSRQIPFRRKIKILPGAFIFLVWENSRFIFEDYIPTFYKNYKRLKRLFRRYIKKPNGKTA